MLLTTDNVESIGSSFVFHPPNSTRPGSVMRQMSNLKLATASITFQIGFSIFTPKIHTSGKSIYKISARFAVHHHDGWAQILFLFLFISSHCSLPCSLVAFIFAFLPQGRQLSAPFVCVCHTYCDDKFRIIHAIKPIFHQQNAVHSTRMRRWIQYKRIRMW